MAGKRGPDTPLPSWASKWLVINAAILVYDGCFCLLRPYSQGDGWIGKLYYGYRLYTDVDPHYANAKDSFVFSQGLGNVIEANLCFMAFFHCLGGVRRSKLLALVASVMSCWKTVLFFLYTCDIPLGGHAVTNWPQYLVLVWGLGAFWIVFPACVAYTVLMDLGWAASASAGGGSKGKGMDEADGSGRRYNLRNRKTE